MSHSQPLISEVSEKVRGSVVRDIIAVKTQNKYVSESNPTDEAVRGSGKGPSLAALRLWLRVGYWIGRYRNERCETVSEWDDRDLLIRTDSWCSQQYWVAD